MLNYKKLDEQFDESLNSHAKEEPIECAEKHKVESELQFNDIASYLPYNPTFILNVSDIEDIQYCHDLSYNEASDIFNKECTITKVYPLDNMVDIYWNDLGFELTEVPINNLKIILNSFESLGDKLRLLCEIEPECEQINVSSFEYSHNGCYFIHCDYFDNVRERFTGNIVEFYFTPEKIDILNKLLVDYKELINNGLGVNKNYYK